MKKKDWILIIVGIGLVLMVSAVLYVYFTPYDPVMISKDTCKQYGGEWETEINLCVNMDKESCESSQGEFLLAEHPVVKRNIPDADFDSICYWEYYSTNQ